jgi:hypothetical protein
VTEPQTHLLTEDDVSGPSAAPGGSNVIRVMDDLRDRFLASFQRLSHGEQIKFDLTFMAMPTAEYGPPDASGERGPQLKTWLVLYAEIRGAIIGGGISGTRMMEMGGQSDEVIDHHVREMIDGLLDARSQHLRQIEIDAAEAARTGGVPPSAGMIHPDGRANPPTWDDMAGPNGTWDDFTHGR